MNHHENSADDRHLLSEQLSPDLNHADIASTVPAALPSETAKEPSGPRLYYLAMAHFLTGMARRPDSALTE